MAARKHLVIAAIALLLVSFPTARSQNPNTFWSDYPACEEQCHESVWASQQCSLQNSCGCNSKGVSGCMCLANSCTCVTSSWLIAVAQCVGQKCGSAAVTNAASIAQSVCNGRHFGLAVPSSELVSVGLAAISSTVAASTSTSSVSTQLLPATSPSGAQNSVPSLVLESISYGPLTTTPTHSPIPSYTGAGSLLQGYCNTPNYVLIDGPTAYWAPMIGCNDDKTDCCPYSVAQQTDTTAGIGATVTVIYTVTADVGPAGATQSVYTGLNAYPVAISTDQASLQHCPDDYQTVSGACCPSGYQLWDAVLGGQVPCYSSLGNFLSPPAVPVPGYETPISIQLTALATSTTSSTPLGKPTSAVINVIFAVQYPLSSAQGLSTGAKVGIGVGAGVGAIAIIGLAGALIWRTRMHNKDKKALAAAQAAMISSPSGLGATSGDAKSPVHELPLTSPDPVYELPFTSPDPRSHSMPPRY